MTCLGAFQMIARVNPSIAAHALVMRDATGQKVNVIKQNNYMDPSSENVNDSKNDKYSQMIHFDMLCIRQGL